MTPVTDAALKLRLEEILDVLTADSAPAWEMSSEGDVWRHVPGTGAMDPQDRLQALAAARAAPGRSVGSGAQIPQERGL